MNSIIEKKCAVVMLPTDEKATKGIGLNLKNNRLLYSNSNHEWNEIFQLQHLYILSDEVIKEGDWFIFKDDKPNNT